jgi:hypothetical protein
MNCPECQGYVVVPSESETGAWVEAEGPGDASAFNPERGVPLVGLLAGVWGCIALLLVVVLAGALGSRGLNPSDEAPDPAALARAEEAARPAPPPPVPVPWPDNPPPVQVTVKRRSQASEEDLRKVLLQVPEVALNSSQAPNTGKELASRPVRRERFNPWDKGGDPGDHLLQVVMAPNRPDLKGLPLQLDGECHLDFPEARALQIYSRSLRDVLANACVPGVKGPCGEPRPDIDILKERLGRSREEEVPALQQILMAEDRPARLLLVDQVSRINSPRATAALVQRALFDLHPEVRQAALRALKVRPPEDYQDLLLEGFRYPWAPAADHAAEAVVELKLIHLIPRLADLLHQPDPTDPIKIEVGKRNVSVVRELIKVNHLGNCLLCHAPSQDRRDLVRGLVPDPSQPQPSPTTPRVYYGGAQGTFVRADITYLRQDFSVVQPVANPGQWPAYQRFDYLVRERALSVEERAALAARKGKPGPYKEAVLFALRGLTGKDLGLDSERWKQPDLRRAKRDRFPW